MSALQVENYEQELIKGCLDNDRLLQKELYDRYKKAMYSLCYRMLGNSDDAHDALQEGFISVFKNIHSYSGKGTLGSWIKTIVLRSALKQLKLSQTNIVDIETAGAFEIPQWPENIDGEMLEKAIALLPEKCRAIFLMIEVEEYSHKEVAELLRISTGTSKSQLNYAKKLLCTKLKSYYESR